MSVTRQSLPAIHRGLSPRKGMALALGAAMLLGGCDTLSSLNPFDKPEVYKPALDAGAKLVFIDNTPKGFEYGKDYVTISTADLVQMGAKAGEALEEQIVIQGPDRGDQNR